MRKNANPRWHFGSFKVSCQERWARYRAALGKAGLIFCPAGAVLGWLLAAFNPDAADTVILASMTPVALAGAGLLAMVKLPSALTGSNAGSHSGPPAVVVTSLAFVVSSFVASLFALGLGDGGLKIGATSAALFAVGAVMASLITVLDS